MNLDATPSGVGRRFLASAKHLLSSLSPRPLYRAPPVAGLSASAVKSSAAGPLIAFQALHRPVWTPRDYTAFAREGFMQNAIVYRCVRMIAECAGSVPLLLYSGDTEIEDHPLVDLLRRPNAVDAYPDLAQAFFGYLLVSGNAYLEAVAIGSDVRELYALRPDRIKVVPGPDGWPEAWDYSVAGRTTRIQSEPLPGMRPVLHIRLFHPDDDHYGMSPLEAAATAIDLHNTASRWNKALLDNSARPSGALVYTSRDGNLTTEQYERLKSELEAGFQGSDNAGRPLLLEGGLDWKSMSLTPKDMDFIEARHAAAREIALALGVPPMLLGIPGDNTFSNYQEANRSFWRSTVLPLVDRFARALTTWLASTGDPAFRLVPDTDAVEALSPERDALWSRLEKTTFLTDDEKRALIGYGPRTDDAVAPAVKFNPGQLRVPAGNGRESGRWTDGGDGATIEPANSRRRFRPGPNHSIADLQRLDLAHNRAESAARRVQELDPTWRAPTSAFDPNNLEGAIAHQEAVARAAEARYAEITRDAIPRTNPSWGVNRLTKELYDQGYRLVRPTDAPGRFYENPLSGDQVRIMERPDRSYRSESSQKHFNDYYYRYKPSEGAWGSHITIPNKD